MPNREAISRLLGCKAIESAFAWNERKRLIDVLSSGKKYEVIVSDLPQQSKISTVYYGKDKMTAVKDEFSIEGQSLKLKIQLQNEKLCIARADKSKLDLKNLNLSLTFSTLQNKAGSVWMDFYFTAQSKMNIDSVRFNIKDKKFQLLLPADIVGNISSITVKLAKAKGNGMEKGKGEELIRKGGIWSFSMPLSADIKKHIDAIQALSKISKDLFNHIKTNKMLSPDMETLPSFETYEKSKKQDSDRKTFASDALIKLELGKLPIKLPQQLAVYKSKKLSEAMEFEYTAMESSLKKSFAVFEFEIKTKQGENNSLLKIQKITVIRGESK